MPFNYKSPGVNRPMRSKEYNPHDNLNRTIYRDQINKIANAVSEIISGLQRVSVTLVVAAKGETNTTMVVKVKKRIWIYSLSSSIVMIMAFISLFPIPGLAAVSC